MASASPPRDLLHFTQPADHVPLHHRIDPQRFGLFPTPAMISLAKEQLGKVKYL